MLGRGGLGGGSVVGGVGCVSSVLWGFYQGVCSYSWGFCSHFGNCYILRCEPLFSEFFPKVFL